MAWTRDDMAARAARELKDGLYVNLGTGIPTLVANYVPPGGARMLGLGPFPYEGERALPPGPGGRAKLGLSD